VRAALLLVLIGAIVFGTLWLGGDRLVSSLEAARTEFDSPTVTNEGVRRKDIWRATWKMIADHPFAGVGMGGYWAAIPTYHDASGTMTPQQAHNDYLELMASGGIVGLAIGVWFVVAVFRRTSANLKTGSRFRRAACFGAAIGLIGVAVHSLVDFGLHLTANALVFAALIVIATGCLKAEGKSQRTSIASNGGQ
jgi:O-antigen ligase